ncbi:MAG: hypothetical protein KDJ69_12210 [Nitratireductor sp.]|nr:hypothetical protein [Nitratireductor sp.]
MKQKILEIRDRATFISVLATELWTGKTTITERYYLERAGYGDGGSRYIIMTRLEGLETQCDPYKWPSFRTMKAAHVYILQHWDELESGDVVDVEFINSESKEPKKSERFL